MRTLAAPLRRAGRLCQERYPGRSRYSFVPGSVAIRSSTGSPPQAEGSSLARLTGGAGRQAFPPSRGAAAGVGWTWDGASAPSPYSLRQLRLISFVPRPTAAAWPDAPRRTVKAGAAGVPSKRLDAGVAAQDTRGGLVVHGQRGVIVEGWPRWLPLGLGSPAAPWS